MHSQYNRWIFGLLGLTVLFLFLHKFDFKPHTLIRTYYTNLESTSTTTVTTTKIENRPPSILERMTNDPDGQGCYSLKSTAMPDEFIDLNAIALGRRLLPISQAPANVTFDQVHTILYGNPTTKSIYSHANDTFKKVFDSSYPHTSMSVTVFNSVIQKMDARLKLQFVVEVGSFTGNSASIMGSVLKGQYPGAFLLCIDTWLGDLNMWVNKVVWNHLAVTEDGRPTVFYQFLRNIIEKNLTQTVLPVSMTSILGARFLRTFLFRPQLIYLDSAHEQGETLIELVLYWSILRPGGVLFGDDWNWQSVRCDVKKFSYMRNITIHLSGNTWMLQKPFDTS